MIKLKKNFILNDKIKKKIKNPKKIKIILDYGIKIQKKGQKTFII
jgi:hypothetical protein